MSITNDVTATAGSDIFIRLSIKAGVDREPVDLTNFTVRLQSGSSQIRNRITIEKEDAEGGVISIFIEGTNPIYPGNYSFRLQLLGEYSIGIRAINIGIV